KRQWRRQCCLRWTSTRADKIVYLTYSTPHSVSLLDSHRYLRTSCPGGPNTDCMTARCEIRLIPFVHTLLPTRPYWERRRSADDPGSELCRLGVLVEM